MRGIIRTWHGDHGFIEPTAGSGPSAFVHLVDLPQPLRTRDARREGLMVEYDPVETPKGPRASRVLVIL